MKRMGGYGFPLHRWSKSNRLYTTTKDTVNVAGSSLSVARETNASEEKETQVKLTEIPKPYLDTAVAVTRYKIDRGLKIAQYLANWKNDQDSGKDWPHTWNTQGPFDPHKVPLNIRMGRPQSNVPQPHKYGNTELLKVQNFLHLTPPAIKKHCQSLKKFCTEWPKELKTDEDCEREFPVEIHTTDYVRSGQYQQNLKARVTTLKIRLSNLVLDNHARVKLIKLAGERYDQKTDVLTIDADRCPVRKQNREYLDYLLTVLYYEAWKTEKWEIRENIVDEDGIYWWKDSISYNNMIRVLQSHTDYKSIFDNAEDKSNILKLLEEKEEVKAYRDAVVNIKVPDQNITGKEKLEAMLKYKESVRTLLNLPQLQ